MDTTTLVYLAIAALLVAALVCRPQGLTLVLALSFLSAVGVAQIAHDDHLKPVLMALDALTVVAAWFLWGKHQSSRASLVAWIGLCKILFAVATVDWPNFIWAPINNALFIAMVLVAGDFVDGIIAWLGRRLAGVGAGRAGVL